MIKASVIIPTYNKFHRLRLTLASLMNQKNQMENFEVIIVDDKSTDKTPDYCQQKKFSFKMKYIQQSKRCGRSVARNVGVRHSDADLIIFIDDDMILTEHFIERHISHQLRKPAIIHGKIMNLSYLRFFKDPSQGVLYQAFSDKKISLLKRYCLQEADIFSNFSKIDKQAKLGLLEKLIQSVWSQKKVNLYWLLFTGGNVSVPKRWFIDCGGFDASFALGWGCEDLELGYRLSEKNYPYHYDYDTINYHIVHYRKNFLSMHQAAINLFFEKHGDLSIVRLQEFINGKMTEEAFLK
jgi:glycosyltransferase involved in cell wall biosynthesis